MRGGECYGLEPVCGGREDKPLGFGLGPAVICLEVGGVAHRLIDALQITDSGDHARCGREDEPRHAALPTGRDNV